MPDLKEKRVELILQQLEDLPTLPAVAVRLLELTSDKKSSLPEVAKLIGSDPSLTARILQLVHRADVGVQGEVKSVERAVVLLGFEAVRSAVLAISVFQTFAGVPERHAGHVSRDDFWKHCVATACCAELLAAAGGERGRRAPGGLDPADAFICGLLHDLGKIALETILPKSFGRVVEASDLLRGNIADVERTVIGLDHMVVGKRLAERWNLPAVVRDCAWLHGQAPQALPATVGQPRMVNLITLADALVREQHLGYSGNYTFGVPRQALLDAVGLTAQQVDDAMKRLIEQIEPRARDLGLGQASSGELYQQALAQANKELGRISGQLASKNRRLAVRAKFFEALGGFQSGLRADASPQLVLQAIAQTAIGVLNVPVVAVFSLPPAQNFAETVVCDQTGVTVENSLIDLPAVQTPSPQEGASPGSAATQNADSQPSCARRPSQPATGDGPVLSVSEELEWFVSAVSPLLPHEQRFWMCLEAEGRCIGGVVWGGVRGEAQRLSTQVQELSVVASGWGLALRTAQIRDEARTLSEQLAESNRQLQTAQVELLRSKTMITVGEMAAGAAHEMNNPLAVISGRSQLLAAQLSDPKLKAAASLIHEQSHRLSAIITELMDFAKPEPPSVRQTELAEVVGRAIADAKAHTDPADRQIEVTMGEVPPLTVDPRQVAAALTEVVENAIQATDPRSGHIELHAAHDPYSSRVVVTVSDNGGGMDEETAKRAFDPFFSAKPAGRRRGLGLAKALRWLEASGGSIRLESRPGQGTRAIMLLPAANAAATHATQTEAEKRKAASP